MPADGCNAGTGLAEVAPQQEKVDRLLQQPRSLLMLRQSHAIAKYCCARTNINLGNAADLRLADSRCLDDGRPIEIRNFVAHTVNPDRVLSDEGAV